MASEGSKSVRNSRMVVAPEGQEIVQVAGLDRAIRVSEGGESRRSPGRAAASVGQHSSAISRREVSSRHTPRSGSLELSGSRGFADMSDTEIGRTMRRMLLGGIPEAPIVAPPVPMEGVQPQIAAERGEHQTPVHDVPVQRAVEVTGPQVQGMIQTHPQRTQPDFTRPRLSGLLKEMRSLGSDTFMGTSNPQEAKDWMRTVNRNVKDMGLSDAERVLVASRLLGGTALTWWDSLEVKYPNGLSWEEFLREFQGQYYTTFYVEQKRQEFIYLQQGTRTVAEYESLLRELSVYAPEMMDTETKRCNKLERGLKLEIRERMMMSGNPIYSEVLHQAFRIEEILQHKGRDIEGKGEKKKYEMEKTSAGNQRRYFGGPHSQSLMRTSEPRTGDTQPSLASKDKVVGMKSRQESDRPPCRYCQRSHTGGCRMSLRCHHCNQNGHKRYQCPLRTQVGSEQPTRIGSVRQDLRRPGQLTEPQGKPSETRVANGSATPSENLDQKDKQERIPVFMH